MPSFVQPGPGRMESKVWERDKGSWSVLLTESDIDQKETGVVSGFESGFVYFYRPKTLVLSHVVLWTVDSFGLFLMFLSLLTLFFPTGHAYQIGSGEN